MKPCFSSLCGPVFLFSVHGCASFVLWVKVGSPWPTDMNIVAWDLLRTRCALCVHPGKFNQGGGVIPQHFLGTLAPL